MRRIKIGVIPAGGKGSRISFSSIIFPKAMLSIFDRPILEFVIGRMVYEFGVEEIYIIVGEMQEVIKNYFKDGRDFGIKIKYIDKRNAQGIADAIYLLKDKIKEPFLVILGDDFTIGPTKKIVKIFFEKRAEVVELVAKEDNESILKSTCCVQLNANKNIYRIVEKPRRKISNIRGCGIYIFNSNAFEYIEKMISGKNGKGITDLVGEISKNGRGYGEMINGRNININTQEDLFLANMLFAEMMKKQDKLKMKITPRLILNILNKGQLNV